MKSLFIRHIALPQDHGSWVFLFSPLLIGLFAGGRFTPGSAVLVLAAISAFLIRQPVTIAVKCYSGRRARSDLAAARFWMVVYALVGLAALAGLVLLGYAQLIVLAVPGLPVFAWHLALVSKRQERRQVCVEIVGSAVLALAAPAAYWIGVGQVNAIGWLLFVLAWLQSAASIVYAYLRLEQRVLKTAPTPAQAWRMGLAALGFAGFNLLLCAVLAQIGLVPWLLALPFGLQFAEVLWGITHPAVGFKPTAIGFRQLAVSTLFTVLFIVTW
jgi:hypothetical protein